MEKLTIRKMLERTVIATNKRKVKKIYLVSTDGEVLEAEFAVDLIQKSRNGISCGKSTSFLRNSMTTTSR